MGDSLVRWATHEMAVPAQVCLKGKSGAHLHKIPQLLSQMGCGSPSVIVVHIGSNDLVAVDFFELRQGIALVIAHCREQFPAATLVWSNILPRMFYYSANSQPSLE